MQGWEIAMCPHALKVWEAWLFACLLSKFEKKPRSWLIKLLGVVLKFKATRQPCVRVGHQSFRHVFNMHLSCHMNMKARTL